MPALVLVALLMLGVVSALFPTSEPATPDDAYQSYRAGERSLVLDAAVLKAYQDYRAGERDLK